MRTLIAALLALIVGGCGTKMAEVPEPRTLPTPDFQRIQQEAGRATKDAVRLLWLGVNANLRTGSRVNLRLRQQQVQIEAQQAQLEAQQAAFEALFNWQDVPFNAGDFAALSPATWTVQAGDFGFYRTLVVNDLAFVWLRVDNTSTSGGPLALTLHLPFAVDGAGLPAMVGRVQVFDFTGGGLGFIPSIVSSDASNPDFLRIARETGSTAYPNVTNNLTVQLLAVFKIVT
jgi:hypothetical protein